MKASTKRSTGTRKPSRTAAERIYSQYVKDLRLLLEQSARREEKLAGMVQAVIDDRFFRPTISSDRTPVAPLVDHEGLSDVTAFDSEEDGAIMEQQTANSQEMEKQFNQLFAEQFGEEPPSERHQEALSEA